MYKLIGHSLTHGAFFLPESQPMTLTERDSSCTIQLDPETAPAIGWDDWILDDDWPEGPTVWRVKGIGDAPITDTATYELEHVIRALEGRKFFRAVTPETITGVEGAENCTARQAVEYALAQQNEWVLGDFDFQKTEPFEFGAGESILGAIEEVTNTLDGCVWEYDMTVFPFVLHIRQRSSDVGSEMRCGRNMSVLKKSVSRGGMFTRIYPVGQNDLHITGDYLSKNENVYGRIDKIETDQTKTTEEGLRAWAQGRLDLHCEPTVSITVTGLELSRETGETLDRIRLNRICRVPLPRKNATILERVTRLQWRDRRKDPESVTVTLANNVRDASSMIRANRTSTTKTEIAQTRINSVFEANTQSLHFELFAECGHLHSLLDFTAESLRVHFDNLNTSTRSEFRMTAESLRISFDNEIESARSEFQMTAQSIRMSVSGVADADGNVTSASIVLAINQSTGTSEAKIDAGHVYIGNDKSTTVIAGKLTASDITAQLIQSKISDLGIVSVANLASTGGITCGGGSYGITTFGVGTLATLEATRINLNGSSSFTDCVVDAAVSNGVLTLTKASGATVTFDKATTLSGAWSGNVLTVTASPGQITYQVSVEAGITYSSSTHKYTAKVLSQSGTRHETTSGTEAYDGGVTAGYNSAKVAAVSWSGNVATFAKSTSGSNSQTLTVEAGISYSSSTHKYTAKVLASGGTRHSVESGTEAYNQGWNDCIDALQLPYENGHYFTYNSYTERFLYLTQSDYANGQWFRIAGTAKTIDKK